MSLRRKTRLDATTSVVVNDIERRGDIDYFFDELVTIYCGIQCTCEVNSPSIKPMW